MSYSGILHVKLSAHQCGVRKQSAKACGTQLLHSITQLPKKPDHLSSRLQLWKSLWIEVLGQRGFEVLAFSAGRWARPSPNPSPTVALT